MHSISNCKNECWQFKIVGKKLKKKRRRKKIKKKQRKPKPKQNYINYFFQRVQFSCLAPCTWQKIVVVGALQRLITTW
jgi:hypothetical protein